jgi:Tol biopolymer transport system component/DNA-binding winged helix-turn-helix (wHTH) protein
LNKGILYSFGPFLLSPEQMVLSVDGSVVPVPLKAVKTLLTLIEHGGEVVSKQVLIEAVWPDSYVEEGNLTQNIFLLRRQLGKAPEGEDYIETIPRRGYRFTVPIRKVPAPIVDGLGNKGVSGQQRLGEDLDLEAHPEERREGIAQRGVLPRKLLTAVVVLVIAILSWVTVEQWRKISYRPRFSGFSQITRDGLSKRISMAQRGGPDAAIFSDGNRIYFSEGSTDAPVISEVSVSGGDTAHLPVPFGLPTLLDISPKGQELLVSNAVDPAAAPPLWLVPLPAGVARPLADITASDASWSPDGRWLAYVRGRELFLANGDGTGSKLLSNLPGNGWHPRWSPDGEKLRFTMFNIKTAKSTLWQISRDGSGLRQVPIDLLDSSPQASGANRQPLDVCCGTWSPDGRDFVFQVTQQGRSDIWWLSGEEPWISRLFRRRPRPVRITAGQLSSLAPAFGPDGRTLFLVGHQMRGELQQFDPRVGQFVRYMDGISAEFVDFSRDGQWVTYVDYPDGTLWRSRVDGTQRLQLTFPSLRAAVPKWSPDGRQIAFYAIGGVAQQQLYLIAASGGDPQTASPQGGGEMQPSWSPDGTELMYSDFPFFSAQPQKVAVHILHLATGQVETVPGSEGFFAPQWSPDGSHAMAFALDGHRIMLFDFRTRTWSQLAQGWGLVRWSADSHWAYYLRYRDNPAIMRVRISDRYVEQVASLNGIRLTGMLAGLEFGLTPQGNPVITHDIGTQEIYSLDWNRP